MKEVRDKMEKKWSKSWSAAKIWSNFFEKCVNLVKLKVECTLTFAVKVLGAKAIWNKAWSCGVSKTCEINLRMPEQRACIFKWRMTWV